MKIILSPVASDHTTNVSLAGMILTIDEQDYDLSVIPEGGQAEADLPFIGIVTRDEVTIQYHYDSSLAEPSQPTDWADYTFELEEGEVPCPINWKPIEEAVIHDIQEH
ncbi:hypothetical protein DN730_09975 [Marinomonas piezotolerans]|uniref:Uncharacterized protein n=1 Tax=Marinomonas piezotolerans TaxID=2213058 RepID=A0A370UAA2_9GAMM|nr:hypothetical protein [Marinomonas piezotolerans]RDL44700.1 hypothetical protein DN730_09975 [Marinomonas piezotolerans]